MDFGLTASGFTHATKVPFQRRAVIDSLRRTAAMTDTPIKVAIVDDDASVRKALVRLLRSAGFEPHSFHCADEFLVSLAQRQPDCLLVDARMPGMPGSALLRRLASDGWTIPAIVITGHEESDEARFASEFPGAVAFLKKPLDDDVLLCTIRNLKPSHRP